MTITEVAISWTFLNKQVSTSQVLRVTNAYGNEFGLEEQSKRILAPPVKQDAGVCHGRWQYDLEPSGMERNQIGPGV